MEEELKTFCSFLPLSSQTTVFFLFYLHLLRFNPPHQKSYLLLSPSASLPQSPHQDEKHETAGGPLFCWGGDDYHKRLKADWYQGRKNQIILCLGFIFKSDSQVFTHQTNLSNQNNKKRVVIGAKGNEYSNVMGVWKRLLNRVWKPGLWFSRLV